MAKKDEMPVGLEPAAKTTDEEVRKAIESLGTPLEAVQLETPIEQTEEGQYEDFPELDLSDVIIEEDGDVLVLEDEKPSTQEKEVKFHEQDLVKNPDGTTNWEETAKKTLKRNNDMRKGVQDTLIPVNKELKQRIASLATPPVREELPAIPFSAQPQPYNQEDPALANLASFIQQNINASFDNKFKTMRSVDQAQEIERAATEFLEKNAPLMELGGDMQGDLDYIESVKQTIQREPDGTVSWFNPKTGKRTTSFKQLLEDSIDIRYKSRQQEVPAEGYQEAMKQVLQNKQAQTATGNSVGTTGAVAPKQKISISKRDAETARSLGMTPREWVFYATATPEQIEAYKQKKAKS